MKKTERVIEKYGKLIDDIDALLDKCEYKSLRFAIVCEANDGSGGIKFVKRSIKSLKRMKTCILKYIKELERLTARYG